MPDAGDAHSSRWRQLIVFSLHGERYGLPIDCVREIIRYTPPAATATARGLIRGMISLRAQVLPVIDLSARLGRELEIGAATRILIIEVSDGVLGLVVEAVDGVRHVPADEIEQVPGAVSDDALGDHIAAIDGQLVLLIDPDRAFGSVLSAAPVRPGDSKARGSAAPVRPGDSKARGPRPRHAGGDLAPPRTASPPRRRSAATPQPPRGRRNPRQGS